MSSDSSSQGFFAHESSYVDEGAQVGEGTKIWHFSHVFGKAVVGKKVSIGQNVVVSNGVTVGDGCKIQNNVSLYEGVVLEDEVFCGPSMVFTNVKMPRSGFPRNTAEDYLETRIKKGASIGANATVVCGSTIGEYAFVAAGAVTTKDVPDFALMAGVPARQIGYACKCGQPILYGKVSELDAIEPPHPKCAECDCPLKELVSKAKADVYGSK